MQPKERGDSYARTPAARQFYVVCVFVVVYFLPLLVVCFFVRFAWFSSWVARDAMRVGNVRRERSYLSFPVILAALVLTSFMMSTRS